MVKSEDRKLVVATRNRGKLREFAAALDDLGFILFSLHDFPAIAPIEETGSTFRENALIKAKAAFLFSGIPALADDSGLEVDCLKGAPGVLSARFAGVDGDDAANNAKLLRLLQGVPREKRTARFRCVLVVYGPGGELAAAEGTLAGYIGTEARGEGGFGYDPLFIVPEFNQTLAQLNLELKNRISHRGRALACLRQKLPRVFGFG